LREHTQNIKYYLRKALDGTKQAAHAWQKYLTEILVGLGGRRNIKDECIYIFKEGKGICILGTHVDDIFPLYNRDGEKIKNRILQTLQSKMEIDDKGEIKYALDTHIERDRERGTLRISQTNYINNIIKEYNLEEAKGRQTPAPPDELTERDIPNTREEKKKAEERGVRKIIGKLWWLALISRPDIICALHKCATWQNTPSEKLYTHLLWIIKYIKHTSTHALVYRRNIHTNMFAAYCDASFASERERTSRIGYIYYFLGCLVSWSSMKSSRVLLSSTEAECYAVVQIARENEWIKEFVRSLNIIACDIHTIIYQDNKSTISLAKGGGHKRSKHFDIEFYFVIERIREGKIQLHYIPTNDMLADMFTKTLPHAQFERLRERMMNGKIENVVGDDDDGAATNSSTAVARQRRAERERAKTSAEAQTQSAEALGSAAALAKSKT